MGDEEDPLTAAVEATLARKAAQLDADAQLARRRLAVWRMHNEMGMSPSAISDAVRDALRERGLSSADIQGAGVGYHSIAKLCQEPRP